MSATIPTSTRGANNLDGDKKKDDTAERQMEQSKAAIENMNEDFDGGSGIGGLKPEAGETRVIGQSDPTGSKR